MMPEIVKILIIFIAGVIVGGYTPSRFRQDSVVLALKEPNIVTKQKERKEAKKKIIIEYLTTLPGSQITSEDVSRMFSVSRSTAAKYLEELEEEGRLKRVIIGDRAENSVIYYALS